MNIFTWLMNIFTWLNDQLFKMLWLNDLMGRLVENVFGLDITDRVGASLQFFLFDTVKIFILLSVPELFIPFKKVVSFHVFQKLTAFDLAYYVLRL